MALPYVGVPLEEKQKKGPGFKKLASGLTGRRPLPASVNALGHAGQMRGTPKPGIAPKFAKRVPRPMNPGRLAFPKQAPPGMGGAPAIQQNPLAALAIPGMAQHGIPNSPLPLPQLGGGAGGY